MLAGFRQRYWSVARSQVTRVKAMFDLPGLYLWHCLILSHEDNEMMQPYCVGDMADCM